MTTLVLEVQTRRGWSCSTSHPAASASRDFRFRRCVCFLTVCCLPPPWSSRFLASQDVSYPQRPHHLLRCSNSSRSTQSHS